VLESGDREAQRAELQRIAAAGELQLLPEVTRLWERTFAVEGFQQREFRPGSLAPELHAIFKLAGPDGAETLVAWAEEEARFVPCLLAAGVALGGTSAAEVGRGAQIGKVQIRRWWFTVPGHRLEVPTYMEGDWYGRIEVRRAWSGAVAAAKAR